jgi:hypothetical protein
MPVVCLGLFRVVLTNRAGFSPDNFERILLDDSAATVADIQSTPFGRRLNLLAVSITRIKTIGLRLVATKANPRITLAEFTGNKFLGHGFGIILDKTSPVDTLTKK